MLAAAAGFMKVDGAGGVVHRPGEGAYAARDTVMAAGCFFLNCAKHVSKTEAPLRRRETKKTLYHLLFK